MKNSFFDILTDGANIWLAYTGTLIIAMVLIAALSLINGTDLSIELTVMLLAILYSFRQAQVEINSKELKMKAAS